MALARVSPGDPGVPRNESRRSFLLREESSPRRTSFHEIAWAVDDGAEVDARAHGARGNGRADDTRDIQSAIDDAARVTRNPPPPPGEYVAARSTYGAT